MTTLKIELGDLRQQVSDAVFEGVRAGLARVLGALDGLRVEVVEVADDAEPEGPPPVVPTPPPFPRAPIARPLSVREAPATYGGGSRSHADLTALAERIYADLKAHPWSSAVETAERLGVTTTEMETPRRLLRGLTARGKPSGQPARIVVEGSGRSARYAVATERRPAPKAK